MTEVLRTPLTQRADYTQKHNAKTGRYGWLRLTPAYSLKVVNEILGACDGGSCFIFVLHRYMLPIRRQRKSNIVSPWEDIWSH